MGLGQVLAAAEIGEASGRKKVHLFSQPIGAVITCMIVGDRHGRKVFLQHRDRLRSCLERIALQLVRAVAVASDHTFQVANADIGWSQQGRDVGEDIFVIAQGVSRATVQHDIACEDDF